MVAAHTIPKIQIKVNKIYGSGRIKILDYIASDSVVFMSHQCGATYERQYRSLVEGKFNCHKCNPVGSMRITKQYVIGKIEKLFGNGQYKICSSIRGTQEPILVRHKCGYEYEVNCGRFYLEGRRPCPKCFGHSAIPELVAELQDKINKYHGNKEYKLLKYGMRTRVLYLEHSCGWRFHSHDCQQTCRRCNPMPRYFHEQIQDRIDNLHGKGEYKLIKYSGSDAPLTVQHCCGNKYTSAFAFSFLEGRYKCQDCHPPNYGGIPFTKGEMQKRLNLVHGDNIYKLLDPYTKTSKPVYVRHKCGLKYPVPPIAVGHFITNGQCGKCPQCFIGGSGSPIREINIRAYKFRIQGYEDNTLYWLYRKGCRLDQIITGCANNRLEIRYKFDGKWCSYYPDFYIPYKNLVIEVKSTWTLGLLTDDGWFERNCAKARRVINRGYKFRLHLWDNKERIPLPVDWYNWEKQDLIDHLYSVDQKKAA